MGNYFWKCWFHPWHSALLKDKLCFKLLSEASMTQGLNEAIKDAWGRVHKLIWTPVREGRSLKKNNSDCLWLFFKLLSAHSKTFNHLIHITLSGWWPSALLYHRATAEDVLLNVVLRLYYNKIADTQGVDLCSPDLETRDMRGTCATLEHRIDLPGFRLGHSWWLHVGQLWWEQKSCFQAEKSFLCHIFTTCVCEWKAEDWRITGVCLCARQCVCACVRVYVCVREREILAAANSGTQ